MGIGQNVTPRILEGEWHFLGIPNNLKNSEIWDFKWLFEQNNWKWRCFLDKRHVEKHKSKWIPKMITHEPNLRKECSLSLMESPKTTMQNSSSGQEESSLKSFPHDSRQFWDKWTLTSINIFLKWQVIKRKNMFE